MVKGSMHIGRCPPSGDADETVTGTEVSCIQIFHSSGPEIFQTFRALQKGGSTSGQDSLNEF